MLEVELEVRLQVRPELNIKTFVADKRTALVEDNRCDSHSYEITSTLNFPLIAIAMIYLGIVVLPCTVGYVAVH